jgi:hypothetical protein
MQESKQQLNYTFLNKEYDSIKKRALISYLINSRKALEDHFHSRTHNMLESIMKYEHDNMKNALSGVLVESLAEVEKALVDPAQND